MKKEIETTFRTEDGVRVSIDQWDDGGAWISIQMRGCSTYVSLTRSEAEQMLAGLQAALGVAA
jgi:hypothetical protein